MTIPGAGFANGVLVAPNVDFRQVTPIAPQMVADGQLLIGASVAPFIRAGHLTSEAGTITITPGPGTINIETSAPPSSGDVVGPNSAISGNIAAYDGITGKLILDSLVPVLGVAGNNIFFGLSAGNPSITGSNNFGAMYQALAGLSTGNWNIAIGGNSQVAQNGNHNIALGYNSLYGINGTAGDNNIAIGQSAFASFTGASSIAIGLQALQNLVTGNDIAFGASCAPNITSGGNNTWIGSNCAYSYVGPGSNNTFLGNGAGYNQSIGDSNTYLGYHAGIGTTGPLTGSNSIIIGSSAGINYTAAENTNIVIGSPGVAGDVAVIRLGATGTQTSCLIAGISGSTVTGAAVLCDATGLLGTVVSSRRYKKDIENYEGSILDLRPVQFKYKKTQTLSFGFIAEEVDEIFPELVLHDNYGNIESIAYHEMPAMLLKEIQRLNARIEKLEQR